MTDRKTASTINDTELDQLYERLQDSDKVIRHLESQERRLIQAEAALARVRAVANRWQKYGTSDLEGYADILLATLNQPAPAAATGATGDRRQS